MEFDFYWRSFSALSRSCGAVYTPRRITNTHHGSSRLSRPLPLLCLCLCFCTRCLITGILRGFVNVLNRLDFLLVVFSSSLDLELSMSLTSSVRCAPLFTFKLSLHPHICVELFPSTYPFNYNQQFEVGYAIIPCTRTLRRSHFIPILKLCFFFSNGRTFF